MVSIKASIGKELGVRSSEEPALDAVSGTLLSERELETCVDDWGKGCAAETKRQQRVRGVLAI